MIAIVIAQFNSHITQLLEAGCVEFLNKKKVSYQIFECPGAVETVVYSTKLLETKKFQSIIVIGTIIKGDTDHYEFVCQYVTNGISALSSIHSTPIVFGILTTQNEEQAYDRAAIDKMNKGKEFAETAIFMMEAFRKI